MPWGSPAAAAPGSLPARIYFRVWAQALTFLGVVLARVFFRADTFTGATRVFEAMVGVNVSGIDGDMWNTRLALVLVGMAILSMKAPTVMELVDPENAGSEGIPAEPVGRRWAWRPDWRWGVAVGAAGLTAILGLADISEFLYYNF